MVVPSRSIAFGMAALVVVPAVVFGLLASNRPAEPAVPDVFLYVNDLAQPPTLASEEFDSITALCQEVDYRTSAEIAVLVVNTTQPFGINAFAAKTFEANGIGKRGMDNGVLILISMDEQAWRIEVGYGLEGVLNDAKVGRIGRTELVPNLETGDVYTALHNTTLAVGQEIVDNYVPGPTPPRPSSLYAFDWVLFCAVFGVLILLGLVVVAVMKKRGHFSYGGTSSGTTSSSTTYTSTNIDLSSFSRRGDFGGGRSGGGGAGGRF